MWTNHAPDLDGDSRTGQSYLSGHHSDTASAQTVRSEEQLCETVLECIAHAALWRFCVNRGSTTARRSCSSSGSTSAGNGRRSSRPRKSLQSLLSTENRTGQASVRTKRRNALNRFANPFYRFWRRRRRKAERGFADRDCITTGNSPQFRFKYPSSYSRHPGLPVCH